MACYNSIPVPSAPSHPLANPGYGKRTVPLQTAPSAADFAHLPKREAEIAAYIDHLPEGAAIDIKTLAAHIPGYGQAACRTALNHLHQAGHLRRIREHLVTPTAARWVYHTYFSRTPRADTWWAAFVNGALDTDPSHEQPLPQAKLTPTTPLTSPSQAPPAATPPTATPPAAAPPAATPPAYALPADAPLAHAPPAPDPQQPAAPHQPHPHSTTALGLLARLVRVDPRMALSATDCTALAPLVDQWLTRGATEPHITQALTTGLPDRIHHPAALAHRRLTDKLPPPAPPAAPSQPTRPPLRIMECTICRTPGRPEALPGGTCRNCRNDPPPRPATPLTPTEVHHRAQQIRASTRRPERLRP